MFFLVESSVEKCILPINIDAAFVRDKQSLLFARKNIFRLRNRETLPADSFLLLASCH